MADPKGDLMLQAGIYDTSLKNIEAILRGDERVLFLKLHLRKKYDEPIIIPKGY